MAWCEHCNENRPIQRQTYGEGKCPFCGKGQYIDYFKMSIPHEPNCRGPVVGALDVCTFCNNPVFARALTKESYDTMVEQERRSLANMKAQASGCGCASALCLLLLLGLIYLGISG